MKNISDTRGKVAGYNDITIPIGPCNAGFGFDTDTWFTGGNRLYCPIFDETHFIHGGFNAEKYSWLRLGLHLCDNSTEAK